MCNCVAISSNRDVQGHVPNSMQGHSARPTNVVEFFGIYFDSPKKMCIHSNLPCIIIRPHNIYGPRMGMSHVIPEMAKRAFDQKKKLTLW